MDKSKSNLTIEDNENEFIYQKKKTGLNIQFNQTWHSLFKSRKNKYIIN